MPHVLEVGSARPADAWWADLRSQLGMQDEEWTGVDMQDSECTDIVADFCTAWESGLLNKIGWDHFGSCVCAETLEHVKYPAEFLRNVYLALRPGAWIVITSPFAFPVHGFPEDYWRFTPSGMQLLLKDAGFENYQALELAVEAVVYRDHLKDEFQDRFLPTWIGAIARKPE